MGSRSRRYLAATGGAVSLLVFFLSIGAPAAFLDFLDTDLKVSPLAGLEMGSVTQEVLHPQTRLRFPIPLSEGQYLRLSVVVQGGPANVRVEGPDRQSIQETRLVGARKVTLSLLSSRAGVHLLELEALQRSSPDSELRIVIEDLRDTRSGDSDRVAAELEETQALESSREDPKAAVDAYRRAIAIWERLDEPIGLGRCLRSIGEIRLKSGPLPLAMDAFSKARQLAETLGDERALAASLIGLGTARRLAGEIPNSIRTLETALELTRAEVLRSLEAEALNALAESFYLSDDRETARRHHEDALLIAKKYNIPKELGAAHLGMADILSDINQPDRASIHYQSGLEVQKRLGDPAGTARALVGRARHLAQMGGTTAPLQDIEQALVYLENDLLFKGYAFAARGYVLERIGDFGAAVKANEEARSSYEGIGFEAGVKALDYKLGIDRVQSGDPEGAIADFQKALSALADRPRAATFSAMGAAFTQIGGFDEAERALEEAEAAQTRNADGHGLRMTQHRFGELDLARSRLSEADRRFQQSIETSQRIRDRWGESESLFGLSRVLRAQGRIEPAILLVRESLAITEALRRGLLAADLRGRFHASLYRRYDSLIQLLTIGDVTGNSRGVRESFQIAEQARSRLILERLSLRGVEVLGAADPGGAAQLVQVDRDLRSANSELLGLQPDSDRRSQIEARMEDLADHYGALEHKLQRESKVYRDLAEPETPGLSEIQRRLDVRDTLLAYWLGEGSGLVWIVSPDSVRVERLAPRKDIEDKVRRFARGVAGHLAEDLPFPSAWQRKDDELARDLSAALKLPRPIASNQRLLIVPDGAVNEVPFAALPVRAAEDESLRFLEIIDIVRLPSLSHLPDAGAEIPETPRRAAIFADPVFEQDDPRMARVLRDVGPSGTTRSVLRSQRHEFPRLQSTGLEAAGITALLGPDSVELLDGFTASKALLTESGGLGEFPIWHFGTHGISNARFPSLSGIALSMYDEAGLPVDGFLTLGEIYSLSLHQDLVVLASCDSAVGPVSLGEGTVSLLNAFLRVGVGRVVGSLWKVDDNATAFLMKRFYRELLEHGDPARALRTAQVAISNEKHWTHPYYWSGFVLQGNPSPMRFD